MTASHVLFGLTRLIYTKRSTAEMEPFKFQLTRVSPSALPGSAAMASALMTFIPRLHQPDHAKSAYWCMLCISRLGFKQTH